MLNNNSLKKRRFVILQPEKWWGYIIAIALIFFVLVPILYMVKNSFVFDETGPRYVAGAREGQFTFFNWSRILKGRIAKSIFYEPALNSIAIAFGMTAISLVIGCLFSWLIVRTNVPFKGFFSTVLIIPYIVPSWTVAMAWITVFNSEEFGGAPGLINSVFGVNPPTWLIYGYFPIVISLGVHYVPYTFIMLRGALVNVDSRLEESAELLKASKIEILRKITLPLVLPALGSAIILTFSKGLGEFATQAFLGLPIRYYTFSTRIYSSLNNRLYGEGYVLALILIGATILTVIANQILLGTRKRYVTISGKGSRNRPIDLGKMKWPATIFIMLFILIFVFAPLLLLSWQTFMKYEGEFGISNFTLHYWIGKADPSIAEGQPGIFRNKFILTGIKNSVSLAALTSVISGFIGILIGYTVVKQRKHFISKAIENLCFTPYLVPGIAFGGILLTIFANKIAFLPRLYGTFALLVIACVVKYLPYSSTAGITAMHQIDPSLEEVGIVHGIGWGTRFRKIIMPLAKSGITSAMLLTFITTMRVLDLVILLVTPKTTLMTSIIFRYNQQDFTQHAYGVMLMIVIIIISGHLGLKKLGGKLEL